MTSYFKDDGHGVTAAAGYSASRLSTYFVLVRKDNDVSCSPYSHIYLTFTQKTWLLYLITVLLCREDRASLVQACGYRPIGDVLFTNNQLHSTL